MKRSSELGEPNGSSWLFRAVWECPLLYRTTGGKHVEGGR
jgi:hypothetical protein